MTATSQVVLGSYPPIPRPAATATVAEVRRAWAAGGEVTIVSPRLSAADLAVPVAGPLAGRRLDNVRRHTGAARLVLVAERGFPVPIAAAPVQWVTVFTLTRSMRRFSHVRVVRVGDVGVPDRLWRKLVAGAAELVDWPSPESAPHTGPAVTALGPAETLPREWPAVAAARLARLVLGRWAGPVRRRLGALRRSLPRRG